MNVGVQDRKHLLRVDLERMRLAAEEQTNILALTTGPGFMRPGLEFLTTTASNAVCRLKEFVFSATDAALLEFADMSLRVKVADQTITRPAVTAAVVNGDFSSGTGWTLTATSGATSAVSGGYLNLTAQARGSTAYAAQAVTVNEPGIEHALRISIERGPVTFRCGSTSGADDLIAETTLLTGTHSLAFTPNGAAFHIQFKSSLRPLKRVDSVTVEPAGQMVLPTIWEDDQLPLVRTAQSADVVFVACKGKRQKRIERRGTRSWSIVDYKADDGPFTLSRTRAVKLKASVTEGNGTLTADGPFFTPQHVGALFRLSSSGAQQSFKLAGPGTYTQPFRVTGVKGDDYNDRNWTYSVAGTWAGTLRWERSFDEEDTGYKAFRATGASSDILITTNVASANNGDNDDNAIIYYRLGFNDTSYTSGVAEITFDYDGGGGDGICRVVGFTSDTQVDIEVLQPFKSTEYTDRWQEGEWSDAQIHPSAVVLADGRLWWGGEDREWGSVSDGFDSFDDTIEGDSGPIIRSIATGGVNDVQWMMALQRLLIGTEGTVATMKSSSFDEPLTPTNNSIKETTTTGAAPIDPVKIDGKGLFVERSGTALMELSFDGASGDYIATQLSKLVTDIFQVGVKAMAVQRRPDTRIWVLMEDGGAVCVVYEPLEEVLAFIPVQTDGAFESVAVLPSSKQDRVYFVVRRNVNGSTVRYVEKMALDSDVRPSTLCKVMDAFKSGVNSPASAVINVGPHLQGKSVVVWADGAPIETTQGVPAQFVVDGSGNATLPAPVSSWAAGLPYDARYKSSRLAYGAERGTAILQKKKVDKVGMVMTDFVRCGIRYGSDLDNPVRPMDPLPQQKDGITAQAIVMSDINDEEPFVFPGSWDLDARACIKWQSPYTATILGLVVSVTTNG